MPAKKLFTYNGMTMSISDWARHLNRPYDAFRMRLANGYSIAEAINHPYNTTKWGVKRGDGCIRPDGYRILSINGKPILEHKLIVEKAIGRKLKDKEEIHHVNMIRSDNRPSNLVVCPDHYYHELLHVRTEALEQCGNADYRRCFFCKTFDDTKLMYAEKRNGTHYHRECRNQYKKNMRKAKKLLNKEAA